MKNLRSVLACLAALRACRRGAAALEFAIIAPITAIALLCIYDLGNALQQQIRLTDAVRAGGIFAASWPDPLSAVATQVTAALSPWANVTVPTPTMACYCWDYSAQTSTSVTCPTSGTDSCTGSLIFQRYVTVTASRPMSPIFLTSLTTTTAQYVARIK